MANPPIQLSLQTDKTTPSLTPPVTPISKQNRPPFHTQSSETETETENVCTYFTDDLEICRDSNDRNLEFGRGVWSIVYKARSTPTPNTLGTPPSSPVTAAQLFAVKAPLRRDARPVLKAEAETLTRLSHIQGSAHHIVPYHGFHTELCALVLTAIPLSLSTYIETQADLARAKPMQAMLEPVAGPTAFKNLARKLIVALNWLHDTAGVVHGDIKPQNILLRESESDDEFPYEPLFIDFSATVEIPKSDDAPVDTTRASMSSFTPPFTAPEMLASLMCSEMAPTPASDVFSLAATLLAAATGDLLIYSNMNHRLRLEMARSGHQIIDFARSGVSGCRVPRNGFVERVVKPAVVKDPGLRISTADWVKLATEA
ncbi:uncharacterized protein N7506_004574 [Penicillium brevicompactum]|uniref:uncharacterized protein n=1 Tax=Penicillium brevicompactum TaxID=5074 RepID=UPI002541445C|nr:uncharacterized protein N7506_004574 [Penicillium brevicompactum]KAJ5336552.1 hypothetical protein N7506_004574 [Penicillium brevicompactum]